eukprot:TRINITY_DN1203_c0_g3_i2.p2 TRINITY_DN1203_c0_g3~~TRINITY_DN1203_c0_g3_i2.p2  ORF type:complete len:177 (+),score=40.37 TRINITY_DN1203_c0_g3_i2:71-601(+)
MGCGGSTQSTAEVVPVEVSVCVDELLHSLSEGPLEQPSPSSWPLPRRMSVTSLSRRMSVMSLSRSMSGRSATSKSWGPDVDVDDLSFDMVSSRKVSEFSSDMSPPEMVWRDESLDVDDFAVHHSIFDVKPARRKTHTALRMLLDDQERMRMEKAAEPGSVLKSIRHARAASNGPGL